jgi:hypothetical protein
MKWAAYVARIGEKRVACRTFVAKPEGKRPLERYRRKWEGNIIMVLQEVGWSVVQLDLAETRDR